MRPEFLFYSHFSDTATGDYTHVDVGVVSDRRIPCMKLC